MSQNFIEAYNNLKTRIHSSFAVLSANGVTVPTDISAWTTTNLSAAIYEYFNPPVPSYTELEYIQGNLGPFINTGYCPSNRTKMTLQASYYRHGGWICGCDVSWQRSGFGIGYYYNFYFGNGNKGDCNLDVDNQTFIIDSGKMYLDGTLIGDRSAYTLTTSIPMTLFALNRNNSPVEFADTSTKIYSCKIEESQNIILDLIPVKDPEGIVCMYDKVSQTFFYNKGSGSFIAGPEKN